MVLHDSYWSSAGLEIEVGGCLTRDSENHIVLLDYRTLYCWSPFFRKVDLHLVLHEIMVLDFDLVLLESLQLGSVGLHLVLHEIMVLDSDLVLLESLLVGRLTYILFSTRS
jgi:hypothetical protein